MPASGPHAAASPVPRCPRCGYDLTGVVATWTDSCPVDGVCSECGLGFAWPDVLRADRQRLPWLYEHAPHWWSVGKAVRTFWLLVLPWRFWGRVRMHHQIALGRAAVWALVCAVVFSTAASIIAGSIASLPAMSPTRFVLLSNWTPTWAEMVEGAAAESFQWALPHSVYSGFVRPTYGTPSGARLLVACAVGFTAVASLIVLVCPSEWRRARVRTVHLARIVAYSLGSAAFAAMLGAMIAVLRATGTVAVAPAPSAAPPAIAGWAGLYTPLAAYVLPDAWVWGLDETIDELWAWLLLAMIVWLAAFWWAALRRGLELRRVWALWILCAIGGFLGVIGGVLVSAGV